MALADNAAQKIKTLLLNSVREKLKKYSPETDHKPFHHRLLGKDRYATFSFIQSMNTTFGMSIWEQVSVILATEIGYKVERQHKLKGSIDPKTEKLIAQVHYDLRKDKINADMRNETELIRASIEPGRLEEHPDSTVDLYLEIVDTFNYFDITTAKPNMKEFVALKEKLLNWKALKLSQDSGVKVYARLGIPYNPYYPEEYERWTQKGLYDISDKDTGEILVGDKYWNFVAGNDVYNDLLDVFKEVGDELRPELDAKFAEFK